MEMMSNAHMTGIMDCENELMPQTSEEKSRQHVPAPLKEGIAQSSKQSVPTTFSEIGPVVAVIKSLCGNSLFQLTIFLNDMVLGGGIERGIFGGI